MSSSIFKYKKFEDKSLSIFKELKIWFAGVDSFNDPFDFDSKLLKASLEQVKNICENYSSEISLLDFSQIGVFSTSRTRKNQLMWSHYADEHRGFCIGFDRLKLEGHLKDVTSVDVRYQSTYPISEISKKLEAGAAENIDLEFLKYKYSYWRYEREWRLIGRNLGGKGVEIDGKMIRSVAFGLRMKEEDKSRLREILSSSEFSHVQIYQSECNDDKFGLKFTRLN